jgi:hypothetical protein
MKPMINNVIAFSSSNIFGFKQLRVALDDKTFFCQIFEDLMKDPIAIGFKG